MPPTGSLTQQGTAPLLSHDKLLGSSLNVREADRSSKEQTGTSPVGSLSSKGGEKDTVIPQVSRSITSSYNDDIEHLTKRYSFHQSARSAPHWVELTVKAGQLLSCLLTQYAFKTWLGFLDYSRCSCLSTSTVPFGSQTNYLQGVQELEQARGLT